MVGTPPPRLWRLRPWLVIREGRLLVKELDCSWSSVQQKETAGRRRRDGNANRSFWVLAFRLRLQTSFTVVWCNSVVIAIVVN